MCCENKKAAVISVTVAVSALTIAAACCVFFKLKNEQRQLGGKLIKVNYKFSKEFDD